MKYKYFYFFIITFLTVNFNAKAAPSTEEELKLDIQAGTNISRGNTQQEDYYAKVNLDYEYNPLWKEILRTRLENKKTNDLRVKERYDVNNQVRYNISKENYRFVELEYIDDRYGGYDYRVSETAGIGRNLINRKDKNKSDAMVLSVQVGIGLRQVKLTTSEKEHSPLARISGDFKWKIKEGVDFSENLDFSIDKDVAITKSDASLKFSMNKSFYIQLGLFIEHRSNTASPDIKKTDSTIMTMVGYSY